MKRQSIFPGAPPRQQRGSILVNAAAGLLIGVILLSIIDLGFVFYFKREYQKSADLAALAGAQQLRNGCSAAETSGEGNVLENLGDRVDIEIDVACGVWMLNADPLVPRFTESVADANAVRVIITGEAPSFFMGPRNISASAIATLGEPLAAFSVGSRAVRVSTDSAIGPLLNGLGLNLSDTALLSYNGLANVKITPGGLLEELGIPVSADIGVGELNALLAAREVSLGTVLNAIVTVAGQSSLASANASLLGGITANLVDANAPLNVRLGSESGASGLFAEIIAPDSESNSALKTEVGVLDLITAAVGVATSENALKTNLNLNLLGLATVTTQVGVVEPPSVAIGGLGANGVCDGNEVCPTAYTAQVRTFIHVKTTDALLKNLLKLDLPIVLDAVSGKGTLQEMCTADVQDTDGEDRAEIEVESTVAKLCIGQIATADLFSKKKVCDENLGTMELLNVADLLRLPNNKINVDALEGGGTVTLREGETGTTGNELQIGTTVGDLVDELTELLFGGPVPDDAPSSDDLNRLRDEIWNDTASVCGETTPVCRGERLNAARSRINSDAEESGLLTGALNGLFGIVSGVANQCTGVLFLGGTEAGCKNMIRNTLASQSNGNTISNALAVLTGILKPVLNELGEIVLTPLLRNVLGVNLGETDVHLTSLSCGGNPRLVE